MFFLFQIHTGIHSIVVPFSYSLLVHAYISCFNARLKNVVIKKNDRVNHEPEFDQLNCSVLTIDGAADDKNL